MIQLSRSFGLASEPRISLRLLGNVDMHELDGHIFVKRYMHGTIHLTHCASPNDFLNKIPLFEDIPRFICTGHYDDLASYGLDQTKRQKRINISNRRYSWILYNSSHTLPMF
jgi:hypothetical protein